MSKHTKKICESEVAQHNTSESLWVIINFNIYDLTQYQHKHPGGKIVLLELAGENATEAFERIHHSQDARSNMGKYCIGELKDSFTQPDDVLREVVE